MLVAATMLLSSTVFSLESDLSLFETANNLYEQGSYEEAEKIYLELLDKGIISDDVNYNLGNTYFKTNSIALAILHYEKALKVNANHEDAAYNLKLANQKTVDKIESIPELFIYRWWKAIFKWLSIDQWATLSIVLFLTAALAFALFLFSAKVVVKKGSFYLAVVAVCIAVVSWLFASRQSSYFQQEDYAIIVQASINVLSAPSDGSSQLFVLHEGTKVKLKSKTNNRIEIALPNGNKGWVEQETLRAI